MKIIQYTIKQINSYFTQKDLLLISFLYSILIYSVYLLIKIFFPSQSLLFIYWNLIYSIFNYASIIFLLKKYLYKIDKKKFININKVIKTIVMISFIKLIWNALYFITLDSNYTSNSVFKTFYPLILFSFSWLYIYFLGSFYIPFFYFHNNQKKNRMSFHHYIFNNLVILIFNIALAGLCAFITIYFITYILKLMATYVHFLQNETIHYNIEILINITLKTLFSHILSIITINTYYFKNIKKTFHNEN